MSQEGYNAVEEAERFRKEGNQRFEEDRLVESCRLYSIAIDMDPTCVASFGNRSQVYLRLKMPKLALHDALQAISLQRTPKNLFRAAQAHAMLGAYTEAQQICQSILAEEPSNALVKGLLKECKLELENISRKSVAVPVKQVRSRLSQLPVSGDVWKIAIQRLNIFLKSLNGSIYRPYGVLIFQSNPYGAHLRAYKVVENKPIPALVVDTFLSACINPIPPSEEDKRINGSPSRPSELLLYGDLSGVKELENLCKEGKTKVSRIENFSADDVHYLSIFTKYVETVNNAKPTNLLPLTKVKGLKTEFLSDLHAAACAFLEKDPWLFVTTSKLFSVKVPSLDKELYFLLLSTFPGTIGLSVFKSKEEAIECSKNSAYYPKQGRVSLAYVPMYNVPHADLDLFEKNNIPLPKTPHSFPLPLLTIVDGKGNLVQLRPLLQDLVHLHIGLLALPDFILEHYRVPGTEYSETITSETTIALASGTETAVVGLHGEAFPLEQFQNGTRLSRLQNDDTIDQSLYERSTEMEAVQPAIDKIEDSDLAKAYQRIGEAFRVIKLERRVSIARDALSISQNCIDAYILLAEDEAETLMDMLALYEAGKAAGERVLGVDYIESLKSTPSSETVDRFWMILDDPKALLLRGYMKCCAGMGSLYGRLNRLSEASDILEHTIKINPHDNQGNRFSLIQLLLEQNRDQKALELLGQYPSYNLTFLFNKALTLYRLNGDSAESTKALTLGLHMNKFVGSFLSGKREYPTGDQIKNDPLLSAFEVLIQEALSYVSVHTALWRRTKGAIEWVSTVHEQFAFIEQRDP